MKSFTPIESPGPMARDKYNSLPFSERAIGFKSPSFLTGFTLIELLVSMGIITILSSALLIGKTTEEKKLALQRMAYQISQDLRQTQEKTLGVEEAGCGVEKGYIFGLNFAQGANYYYLFVDCDKDHQYDTGEEITKISLEKGVEIFQLSPLSPLNIVFEPPEPLTYINNVQWGAEAIITLKGWEKEKKVTINSAGNIKIE